MQLGDCPGLAHWHASLALGFERRGARSVLATRAHDGPLVVQKTLYPEGDGVCHAIVVHPPAGLAGGDELEIAVRAAEGASALLTTPGAGKWYRSNGPWARQHVSIDAKDGARVEWLPQETILFDGSLADIRWQATVAGDARLIAWEILCLGRTGSGERYAHGRCRLESRLVRDGRLAWIERGRLEPGGRLAESDAGLAGCSVAGTMFASAPAIDDATVAACRAIAPRSGEGAVTRLPGVLVARYRGDASEAARQYFTALWTAIRPGLLGREATLPRIWRT
jgi:urease accessory protein